MLVLALACCTGDARGEDSVAVRRAPNVLAWPVYVRWDSDSGNSLRVVGPVTTLLRTRREHSFHAIYPMTGLRRLRSGRTELDLVWPLTSVVHDPARGFTAVRLATPLVSFERRVDGRVSFVKLSPLYTDERRADGHRRFEIAPLYWRSDDPARLREACEYGYVPLLGGGGLSLLRTWSTPGSRGWSSTILAGGAESADERWRWLFPYFSYERSAGDGPPVRFRTFGGAWADWCSPARQGWEFALLWSGGRDGDESWLSAPPWVSYARTDSAGGTRRFRTLLPLWARWQSPRTDLQLALPAMWRWRSERLESSGAWPLFAGFRRARADSSWRAGGSFAWPFVSWGGGEGYSAFGVLPLYYRMHDGATSLTLAPPLYGSFRDPGRDIRVVPLAWFRRFARDDSLEFFTLYYRHRRRAHFAQGIAGLWESSVDGDARRSWVFPVWYHRRDPNGEQLAVPGWIDWRSTDGARRTFLAGPVVVTRGHDTRGFGILPVFYTGSWPGGGAGLAGPVFWGHGPGGGRRLAVVPLAWYARGHGRTDLFLLPLTGVRRHADGRSSAAVLWPLYTRGAWPGGRTRHSLLLGLGRDERSGEKRRTWLQPLFYYDRPSAEKSWFAVLGGMLASYEREGAHRRLRLLLIPVRSWKG